MEKLYKTHINVRCKMAVLLSEEIRKQMVMAVNGAEDVSCIDSKLRWVCRNARVKRCVLGCNNINATLNWGYCAAQVLYSCGCELHATCRIRGVKHSPMTAASVYDFINHRPIWKMNIC